MPRIRVHHTTGHTQAACPTCTWICVDTDPNLVHTETRKHAIECGKVLWLTPSQFTHEGDSNSTLTSITFFDEPDMWAYRDMWAYQT